MAMGWGRVFDGEPGVRRCASMAEARFVRTALVEGELCVVVGVAADRRGRAMMAWLA